MVGERGQFRVRASKGIHLVVPRDRIQSQRGLILRTEKSVLFVIPWGRHWIIGTTDTDWSLDKAHPAATAERHRLPARPRQRGARDPLTREDVEGVYAGLRPLLSGESESTSKLSREHAVAHPVPGLVVVAGGKYTTYRVMAKDAVDAAVRALDGRVPASCTEDVPLVGAEGYRALWNQRERLAGQAGLHVARIEHLLGRYGSLIDELLDLIAADPTLGRAAARRRRLPAGRGRLRGQPRGRPAPRRRADPAHPDLDRDLRPRHAAAAETAELMRRACWAGTPSRSSARSSTTGASEAEREGKRCPPRPRPARLGPPDSYPCLHPPLEPPHATARRLRRCWWRAAVLLPGPGRPGPRAGDAARVATDGEDPVGYLEFNSTRAITGASAGCWSRRRAGDAVSRTG